MIKKMFLIAFAILILPGSIRADPFYFYEYQEVVTQPQFNDLIIKPYYSKNLEKLICYYLNSEKILGANRDKATCKCLDGFIEQPDSTDCIAIVAPVVCEDENAESVDNAPCTCKEGFAIPEGEALCKLVCPAGQEAIGNKCYDSKPTCSEGFIFNTTENKCIEADLHLSCTEGQGFDSDKGVCFDLIEGEGGGCSISNDIANPTNLILLLSFLIPVFKRKKK